MKRNLTTLLILIVLIPLALMVVRGQAAAPKVPTAPSPTPDPLKADRDQIEQAILAAIAVERQEVLGYLVYQQRVGKIQISADHTWAVAILAMVDPDTSEVIPTEPGLVVVQRSQDGWRVTLPGDADWATLVAAVPAELLSQEKKDAWLERETATEAQIPTAPLAGYLLPWDAGLVKNVSQTVGHDQYTPSGTAHFAFDFYVHETLWDVLAAKAGTVWRYKMDVPTCYDYTCSDTQALGNYIVLRDTTTTPVSYQLYLHLAFDSLPPTLRHIGAPVVQGQFIGIADNTGQSWGDHLHFQVHTNPNSYWGQSVDITFLDVDINGGRPRVTPADPPYCKPSDVCNTYRLAYTSANIRRGDDYYATGDLTHPATGDVITSSVLSLAGYGYDSTGLQGAQFMAAYNGNWHNIGPEFTSSPFSYDWDLCADDVPNGAITVGERLTDNQGNVVLYVGLKHVTKNFACLPQPACTPGPDQVALFRDINYQGCTLFDIGEYAAPTSLGGLGDKDAELIRVGANVMATLYISNTFQGRGETFLTDDANLADNIVGADTVSSLQVQLRTQLPAAPVRVNPPDGLPLRADTSVILAWDNTGGSTAYQVRMVDALTHTITSTWMASPYWNIGSLAPMSYTWQVRGQTPAGEGPWSAVFTFDVPAPSAPPAATTVPYNDDMETSESYWLSPGYWGYKTSSDPTVVHSGTHAWWYQGSGGDYDNEDPNNGDLTSRPIAIPESGTYTLRFWYRYETETNWIHWDQRWVQISVDGGLYTNVLQLYDDPKNVWLRSPGISLAEYAGHTIQVRFHFDTVDAANNLFKGWGIDDLSITAETLPICNDPHEPNNTPVEATPLNYNSTLAIPADICPGGDKDFYQFVGTAGERIVVDIDAQSIGSDLDPYLFLLDADGTSVLASQDDRVAGSDLDPLLGYVLPRDGVYYLKVRAWDHPRAGGPTYNYTLRLYVDNTGPSVLSTFPEPGTYLNGAITVMAQVTSPVGIDLVEFYWHDGDWAIPGWTLIGTDSNGADGWSMPFNPSSQADTQDAAFYLQIYDRSGNRVGAGIWNLGIDHTPPVTAMSPLSPTQTATAFLVKWTGSDAGAGVEHYDLQWKVDSGVWQNYQLNIRASDTHTWVVGVPGSLYGFRMRGVDLVGNVKDYPANAETTTLVTNTLCTTPDAWELDNTSDSATLMQIGTIQVHNFCNPLDVQGFGDEDWVKFPVQPGKHYLIQTFALAGGGATAASLYSSDGVNLTLQVEAQATGFDQPTTLEWIAEQNEMMLYLRIRPIDSRIAGVEATYRVQIIEGYGVMLPIVPRH